MTREEALNIFKSGYIFEYSRVNADGIRQIDEAVKVAIKALEQEPCEQIKWERDTAIKQLNELGYSLGEKIKPCEDWKFYYNHGYEQCKRDMEKSKQEQKTGHWIKHEQNGIGHIECSECLAWFLEPHLLRNSYCPNCGARMESEEQ